MHFNWPHLVRKLEISFFCGTWVDHSLGKYVFDTPLSSTRIGFKSNLRQLNLVLKMIIPFSIPLLNFISITFFLLKTNHKNALKAYIQGAPGNLSKIWYKRETHEFLNRCFY